MAVSFHGPQGQEVWNERNGDCSRPGFIMGVAVHRTIDEATVSAQGGPALYPTEAEA